MQMAGWLSISETDAKEYSGMPHITRSRGINLNAKVARSRLKAPEARETSVDLGFASTVYGQDAAGNMVEINGGDVTMDNRPARGRAPWRPKTRQ